MKHLLTPITVVAWYYIVYLAMYACIASSAWFFTLNWFWIIIATVLLSSLIMGLMTMLIELPTLISTLIFKLYNFSWVSVILHSLAGLAGIVTIIDVFFFQSQLVNNSTTSFISGMWNFSVVRTMLFFVFTLPFFIGFLYTFVIMPVQLKLSKAYL